MGGGIAGRLSILMLVARITLRSKMWTKSLRACLALLVVLAMLVDDTREAQAFPVFDSANYAQNLINALRTLSMVKNQVKQLTNEAKMLIGMGKELKQLGYNAAGEILGPLDEINDLVQEAQGLSNDIAHIDSEFKRLFPEEIADVLNSDALKRNARERRQLSRQSLQQSLRIQARVVGNVEHDIATLDRLLGASQSAVGGLQARQAGNQLAALNAKQQLQSQELMAAQYRAQSLEHARQAATEAQGRARFAQFIGDSNAYTPGD